MRIPCALALLLLTAPWAAARADTPPPAPASVGQAATPEPLVGEDRAVPTALPTPAADEGGPVMVSRTGRAAPSFALPAFVVRGGGERLDLVQRGDLGGALDTSGGIKTSPGEAGAGRDQRATEAARTAPQEETYTPTPDYGELTAAYGLGDTLDLNGLLAGEQGPWYGWLEGSAHNSDGGPLPSSYPAPDQSRDGSLSGRGGWRMDATNQFDAAASGQWRAARLSSLPGASWEQRSRDTASLGWDGSLDGIAGQVQVQGGAARAFLPGYAYREDGGSLEATAEKGLDAGGSSVLLDGGVKLGALSQDASQTGRTLALGRAWAVGHLEPWEGSRLGVGFRADWASGAVRTFELGPRVTFEQRLTRDLGLRFSFGTGLSLSSLGSGMDAGAWYGGSTDGSARGGEFGQDPLLPNAALSPTRHLADVRASIPWNPRPWLTLEAGGFLRQDGNAFLPGQAAQPGLWTDTAVGGLRVQGVSLSEGAKRGAFSQGLKVLAQSAALEGTNVAVATFIAPWIASAKVGYALGAWTAGTGLKVLGPRQAALEGGWVLPAQWDWTMRVAYKAGDHWTLFLRGDSLAGAVVDWPGFTEPAPYLGLGAKISF